MKVKYLLKSLIIVTTFCSSFVVSEYKGDCKDIYTYLDKKGYVADLGSCDIDEEGNVTSIHLRNNNIESLPDTFGDIPNVEYIELKYNNLTSIPNTIGNLKKVEYLDLSNNLIDDVLPESLNNIPKLFFSVIIKL
ncbi:hypothetical protein PIROE2DRAFT_59065 [Piromyces sp. E2]|nr:hypothetical protein PIROE2DRAFT_59065 [Piromyces sp. E2]|eukprot:OUM66977.1 hypothetical protein PIROE2DRAFT_59065 [Piromyces sp. E2]